MEFDRSIFATNEEDLQKIYEEELKIVQEKQFIVEILKNLDIEDFQITRKDSKARIEEALRILRIHDDLHIGNGLKLFGE